MSSQSEDRSRSKSHQFRLGFLVHDVSRMRRTFFDQAVKPLGVTRSQWWLLANLSRQNDDGMTQTDLARLMDLGKVTVGGLIDRLEATGHVGRRAHPQDRRVKLVHLTRAGSKVLEQMQIIGKSVNAEIYEGINQDDIRVAEKVLSLMKENLRLALKDTPVNEEDI